MAALCYLILNLGIGPRPSFIEWLFPRTLAQFASVKKVEKIATFPAK